VKCSVLVSGRYWRCQRRSAAELHENGKIHAQLPLSGDLAFMFSAVQRALELTHCAHWQRSPDDAAVAPLSQVRLHDTSALSCLFPRNIRLNSCSCVRHGHRDRGLAGDCDYAGVAQPALFIQQPDAQQRSRERSPVSRGAVCCEILSSSPHTPCGRTRRRANSHFWQEGRTKRPKTPTQLSLSR
jgi:hypothetical protein